MIRRHRQRARHKSDPAPDLGAVLGRSTAAGQRRRNRRCLAGPHLAASSGVERDEGGGAILVGTAIYGFVTNSISAQIAPNGAYRQAVVQAAMHHAVRA